MLAKKITGKPYAGKLHVRFDEGKRMRGVKIYSDLCILFLLYFLFGKPFWVKGDLPIEAG